MFLVIVAFATALAFRVSNAAWWELSPVDELYHLKRMTHFVDFDADRNAFCPWPPLYDRLLGGIAHLPGATTQAEVLAGVKWIPPIGSALFVAAVVLWMDRRFGRAVAIAAGAALAASPFVVTQSWIGSIDHHWTGPVFVARGGVCWGGGGVGEGRHTPLWAGAFLWGGFFWGGGGAAPPPPKIPPHHEN